MTKPKRATCVFCGAAGKPWTACGCRTSTISRRLGDVVRETRADVDRLLCGVEPDEVSPDGRTWAEVVADIHRDINGVRARWGAVMQGYSRLVRRVDNVENR